MKKRQLHGVLARGGARETRTPASLPRTATALSTPPLRGAGADALAVRGHKPRVVLPPLCDSDHLPLSPRWLLSLPPPPRAEVPGEPRCRAAPPPSPSPSPLFTHTHTQYLLHPLSDAPVQRYLAGSRANAHTPLSSAPRLTLHASPPPPSTDAPLAHAAADHDSRLRCPSVTARLPLSTFVLSSLHRTPSPPSSPSPSTTHTHTAHTHTRERT